MIITELFSKCVRGINEHLLKTSGADVLSSWKNPRKPKGGWHPPPPPHPLYVRGLKRYFFEEGKLWQRIDVQPVPLAVFHQADNLSIQKAGVH